VDSPVVLEDIEAMRREQGIDDVELREQVRGLRAGDHVKITFLSTAGAPAGETLPVRIIRVRGPAFRGELAARPASGPLAGLRVGSRVTFTAAHVHSVLRKRPTHVP
jgi:hypothetical protein